MSDFVGLVREKTGFGLSFVLLVFPLDLRESHLHCSSGVHLEICVIEMTVCLAIMMGSIVVFGQSKIPSYLLLEIATLMLSPLSWNVVVVFRRGSILGSLGSGTH